MSNAQAVKGTIESTQKTSKITQAMQLVAASKLGKAQASMRRARPYAEQSLRVVGHVASSQSEYRHPYFETRKNTHIGYIVVSSDRGLCGGLNSNLFRQVAAQLAKDAEQGQHAKFSLIGSKATSLFSRHGGEVLASVSKLGDAPSLVDIIGVVTVMTKAFLDGQVDKVVLASNQFVTTMTQQPNLMQLLPIIQLEDESTQNAGHWDYVYEPDAKAVIDLLLRRHIEAQVYRAVIENIACEHAARMLAMQNATDNAGSLIEELRLMYNKSRQAAITQELSEIVAGAAAVH